MPAPRATAASPTVRPGRRIARALLAVALFAVALLAGTVATLAWLGSERGLHWLADRSPLRIGTLRVQLHGVDGNLWGRLQLAQLRIDDATRSIRADDVTLDWVPQALVHDQLLVPLLRIGSLDVLQRGGGTAPKPAALPASLRLPLRVDLLQLRIDRMRTGRSDAPRPIGDFTGSLRYAGASYRWQLNAHTPWAHARAGGSLGDASPYALRARAQLTRLRHDARAHAELRADGSLLDLQLDGALQAAAARAHVKARLLPFAAEPLASATLRADAIDPAAFDPALPHAALNVLASVVTSRAARLRGSVTVTNAIAGPLSQRLLPLRALRATLDGPIDAPAVPDLRVDLGAAGSLQGALRWHGATLHASLHAAAIDAHAIDTRLLATRLGGPLELDADGTRQTLSARLAQRGWALRLRAAHDGATLHVDTLQLDAPGGQLHASGRLGLDRKRPFVAQATLRDFDPARFGSWPRARLNGVLHADGVLAAPQARITLALGPGQWRGHALGGRVALLLQPGRVSAVDTDVHVGTDRLRLRGAFGAPGDSLHWQIDAPTLQQLEAGARGSVRGSGILRGGLDAPAATLQLQARDLHWRALRLQQLQASAALRVAPAARPARNAAALLQRLDGHVALQLADLHAALPGTAAGRIDLADFRARLDGAGAGHRLALDVRGTLEPPRAARLPLDLQLRADGGWDGRTWHARIERLDNATVAAPLQLLRPTTVAWDPAARSLRLDACALRIAHGEIDLQHLRLAPGALDTAGALQHIDTAALLRLAGVPQTTLRSTMVMTGAWDLQLGAQARGSVQLQRDSGDLSVGTADPPLPLDIGRLVVDARLHDDQVDARGVLLSRLGSLQASGSVALQRRTGAWTIDGTAPLRVDIGADIPDLDWTTALLGPGLLLAGHARVAVHGVGSLDTPQFSGSIDAGALQLDMPNLGLALHDGSLQAHFDGDHLRLDRLQLAGGSGTLDASGAAQLRDGRLSAQLQAQASRLQVLHGPDADLVLSGSAQADVADRLLRIHATLRADHADIALLRASGPTLSRDVVVLGRAPAPPPAQSALPTRVRVDADVDLGDAFHVRGDGLQATLGGSLQLRAADGAPPVASGTVVVTQGAYTAYGQNLQIQDGRVNFNGPLDNPGLNIAATRPGLPPGIVVGVTLGGTAQQPQVRLTSTPSMPDTEILSWLALGEPLDQVGPNDFGVLRTAAAALMGNSDSVPLQTRIAHAVGLDSIDVQNTTTASGTQESLLTVSKRLSSKLQVGFSRGIDGVSSLFNVQYQLSRRLSLRTRTGTENAVDVFYSVEFQ